MKLNFEKLDGLIPAIVQDATTNQVLMFGFMNRAAYQKTRASKRVTFFSRSKKRLWTKGETSGNFLTVVAIKTDCDSDALLIKAIPCGTTCHTGAQSCFGESEVEGINFLESLFALIKERKRTMPRASYTASLFREGLSKIGVKVIEEAEEVVHAACAEGKARLIEEISDLLYHVSVLMVHQKVRWKDIVACLLKRVR